jgi:hypothetical protein
LAQIGSKRRGVILTYISTNTYGAGHISTILTRRRAGSPVLGESIPDARLARYFDLCLSEATTDETLRKIEMCRRYFEKLNRMLEVGRRVVAR